MDSDRENLCRLVKHSVAMLSEIKTDDAFAICAKVHGIQEQ